VTLSASPNRGYTFLGWVGVGSGAYSGSSAEATAWVNGSVTETAHFASVYSVTFTESGLPPGHRGGWRSGR